MVLRSIAPLNQNDVAVLQVNPMIGHRTASERLSQSRYSGRVSDPGLVINIHEAHGRTMAVISQHSSLSILELPMWAMVSRRLTTCAFAVFGNEVGIPGRLDLLCDPSNRPIPGFCLPLVTVRGAIKTLVSRCSLAAVV